ncbi:MAG: DUF1015 domain-containing protein [Candidatus Omnitrophota bacterium]
MAEVRPFKGFLYNGTKIKGGYSSVMAPPYDVISDKMRDELYDKSEYNIIRLILGKCLCGSGEGENKYTRAGKLLAEWCGKNIMARDGKESFYVYVQEYSFEGEEIRRIGFIGLMEISDSVLPHEYTLAKPKEDRMNLIKQVKGNLSPIFSLYEDKNGEVSDILERGIKGKTPLIDIICDEIRHMLWRLSDSENVAQISRKMNGRKTFIADGHHRYEVARAYRDAMREQTGYKGEADHVMMYFTDLNDAEKLTVVATHRVIKKMPQNGRVSLVKKLDPYFSIEEKKNLGELTGALKGKIGTDNVFGYIDKDGYLLLIPKDKRKIVSLIKDTKSEEWKKMDVSVLHSSVFKEILGLDVIEGNITYVKKPEEAETLVKDNSHEAAFLLNPTRVEQLRAVAEMGDMMPQKSTYFYPKLLSGLVINKFGE